MDKDIPHRVDQLEKDVHKLNLAHAWWRGVAAVIAAIGTVALLAIDNIIALFQRGRT